MGFYTKVDLGIVKYHFELGAGRDASAGQNKAETLQNSAEVDMREVILYIAMSLDGYIADAQAAWTGWAATGSRRRG